MKYCKQCGKPMVDEAMFCSYCGAEVTKIEQSKDVEENVNKNAENNENKQTHINPQKIVKKGGKVKKIIIAIAALAVIATAAKIVIPKLSIGGLYIAPVKDPISGMYGYIDDKGNTVIDYTFEGGAYNFSEDGTAMVENDEGNYAYINKKGELITDYEYDQAYDSVHGMALVGKNQDAYGEDVQYGYIDKSGSEVIPCQYKDAGPFGDNGLACVCVGGTKYIFIDESGKQALEEEFHLEKPGVFNKGLANVSKRVDGDYKYGFINESGELVIDYQYENASAFYDNGLALVEGADGKIGAIDKKGEMVIPLSYSDIENSWDFSDKGMPLTASKRAGDEEKYGFIDKKGNEVVNFIYAGCRPYGKNGLAPVAQGNKKDGYTWGYVNKKGEETIPMQFVDAYSFSDNGLASVQDYSGSWYYINKKGEKAFSGEYSEAGDFIKIQ